MFRALYTATDSETPDGQTIGSDRLEASVNDIFGTWDRGIKTADSLRTHHRHFARPTYGFRSGNGRQMQNLDLDLENKAAFLLYQLYAWRLTAAMLKLQGVYIFVGA